MQFFNFVIPLFVQYVKSKSAPATKSVDEKVLTFIFYVEIGNCEP